MPSTIGIVAAAIATEIQGRVSGNGNYIYCADNPGIEVPTDFDVAWFGSLDAVGVAQTLICKFSATTAGRSWMVRAGTTNIDTFTSSTGTDQFTGPTAPLSNLPAATMRGVRFTRRKSDGLSRIYTSPSDPPVWTKVGELTYSAGVGQWDSATMLICFGGHTAGSVGSPTGYFRRAEIRNGFELTGSIVASPDVTKVPTDATSFVDAQGNTWILAGTASLVARRYP